MSAKTWSRSESVSFFVEVAVMLSGPDDDDFSVLSLSLLTRRVFAAPLMQCSYFLDPDKLISAISAMWAITDKVYLSCS